MTKTASFAIAGFTIAFDMTWWLKRSLVLGGLVALIDPMVNPVAYHVRENAWIRFGQRHAMVALAA